MSELGDAFRSYKAHKREVRMQYGIPCPDCTVRLPKAQPKILMPAQKCWCGYVDTRPKLTGDISTQYGTEKRGL